MMASPIVLFTDFGPSGPYIGQMEAVLLQLAPQVPVIRLLSNAPVADPRLSAYLLSALQPDFPVDSVFLCVVDPGVGSARRAVVLWADGRYFVGPDNGLLNTVAVQAERVRWWCIDWRPERCSASFHGRDLFAPIAARLATGDVDPYLQPIEALNLERWPADLPEIIYFDDYGNAMTGLRYRSDRQGKKLVIGDDVIEQGETFSSVRPGEAFWYQNSSGLVEIAVNRGRARQQLKLQLGAQVSWAGS